jgi:hypothetical protein
MPAMPMFASGDMAAIAAELARDVNPNQLFRVAATTITLQSDKATAKAEVLLLMPEELAMELELMRPSVGT